MRRRGYCLALLAAVGALATAPPAVAVEKGLNVRGDQSLLAQQSGAGWVRLFVSWAAGEPAKGTYVTGTTEAIAKTYADRGIKVFVVVSGTPAWANGGQSAAHPPADPGDYGTFVAELARRLGSHAQAYEVWNEPDGDTDEWWAGSVEDYAALLRATYPLVKAAAPTARVLTAGLVGNDFAYVRRLYELGAGGSFDVVAVHTDTACLDKGPDFFYREPTGEIGRYSFTGYREVHHVMAQHGDGHKPIWITELGWNTKATPCDQGQAASQPGRMAGVDPATQAAHLARAYQCLAQDPYVEVAAWFELADRATSPAEPSPHFFGLLTYDGVPKPAWAAFVAVDGSTGAHCGGYLDKRAPAVTITRAGTKGRFTQALDLAAEASDDFVTKDIDFFVDGVEIANRTETDGVRATSAMSWQGAKQLKPGKHVIEVRARDEAQNVGVTRIEVEKVDVRKLKLPVKLVSRVSKLRGRRVTISGSVKPARTADKALGGRIFGFTAVDVQRYDAKLRRWVHTSGYRPGAAKVRYRMAYRFKKPGRWRVRVRYLGRAPYASTRVRTTTLTVR